MLITLAIKVNFVTLPAGWFIIMTPVSGTSWFVLAREEESLGSTRVHRNIASHI